MMKFFTRPDLHDSIRPERVKAMMDFGFTEPQARFLLHVLIYSGVFIERQYRALMVIKHGQKTKDFLANLVGRGYATSVGTFVSGQNASVEKFAVGSSSPSLPVTDPRHEGPQLRGCFRSQARCLTHIGIWKIPSINLAPYSGGGNPAPLASF